MFLLRTLIYPHNETIALELKWKTTRQKLKIRDDYDHKTMYFMHFVEKIIDVNGFLANRHFTPNLLQTNKSSQ